MLGYDERNEAAAKWARYGLPPEVGDDWTETVELVEFARQPRT